MCVAAVCLGIAPQSQAGGLRRMSCTVARFYAPSAAGTWARSKGATDAEIAARHCLKDSPVQAVTNVSTTVG
jgi:hypothetical protein